MSERKFDPALLIVLFIGLVVVGVGFFIFSQIKTDEISLSESKGETFALLLMIRDGDQSLLSSVLLVNTKTKRMALVDVPENLGAIIGSLKRVDSVDVLYKELGVEEYRGAIARLMDQAIPFYLVIEGRDAGNFVDLLGGLPVFIADSIDDQAEDKLIRIPSGNVTLDGEKTLDFLSYKESSERELERSNRRWTVAKALLMKMGDESDLMKKDFYGNRLYRFAKTNLDEQAFLSLCELLPKLDIQGLTTQRIIGNTRVVDTVGGQKSLLFPHFEGQLLRDSLRQMITSLDSLDNMKEGGAMVRVEILNGTDQSGLARRTRDLFQSYGFEVVSVGNTPSTAVGFTQVIDRKGNPSLAERAAKVIKCERIVTQIEGGDAPDIDVTIILGKDFNGWTVRNQ